ncbi:translocation and assembly module lipoprotein TamL [Faecalibacter bovis]|uniref:BamA/TamA family outer membrane protein n=1 Tax=Faecalibacter bovis TaxID=2898187 RepID=A0ABX7XCM2_9FLAO|nr:BamA/TamA family outer membrane protein [Faecalibacter bovis]QTV05661.1 BamA/TamA family outer membrane protein [Faecalibacter bovis]
MKKSIEIVNKTLLGVISFFAISSCSNTQFLQEDEKLYVGADIEIVGDSLSKKEKSQLKTELESRIIPKPNSSFLGLRPQLYIYNITSEPKNEKGLRHWLKYKIGEAPVLMSQVDTEFNNEILTSYASNVGYFNAIAKDDTIVKNKKASVNYVVQPKARYFINKVNFPTDTLQTINKEITNTQRRSLLRKGRPYNLNTIISERERIDERLKEKGFYYFHPDNIILKADSISTQNQVELSVQLKENTPTIAKQQYTIDNIFVFPDYNITDLKKNIYQIPLEKDSLTLNQEDNFYMIDPYKKFKPKIFERALQFKKGELYNRTDHNLTLNRLVNLGVFKFVNNQFIISDSINNKFDAYYMLTPREFQSLRLELLGRTNSANYGGGEINLNWTHRNLLRGAEQLKATIFGAFDMQLGGPKDANNIFRMGTNVEFSIPRIIAPFRFHTSGAYIPRTNVTLAYEYLNRTRLYALHNFNTSFGYQWKENARKDHDLKVLEVTLVKPDNVSDEYYNQIYDEFGNIINPQLKRVVDKQLIFGPRYSYTYTTTMLPRKNTIYYRGMVDLSANLTGLISGANIEKGNQKEIFNIPFSQYAKMEHDFRFFHKFNRKTSIATRFIGGIALPYGNSEFVPFSKQFFVGGSNSIRAFRARTLGPGSYDPRNQNANFYFDQAGDIKLELNAEYRMNLFKFLNLGFFVDAGNIWTVNEEPTLPGGKFSKDFINEIAIGTGLGVRLDFSLLILRFDFAMPLRVPYYEKNDRWTFDKIDFSDKDWRKDNLILNIAIGYPF